VLGVLERERERRIASGKRTNEEKQDLLSASLRMRPGSLASPLW
jgi:hypothetical protein